MLQLPEREREREKKYLIVFSSREVFWSADQSYYIYDLLSHHNSPPTEIRTEREKSLIED